MIEYIAFICLFILSTCLMKNVFEKYIKRETSLLISEQPLPELPTLTLCFLFIGKFETDLYIFILHCPTSQFKKTNNSCYDKIQNKMNVTFITDIYNFTLLISVHYSFLRKIFKIGNAPKMRPNNYFLWKKGFVSPLKIDQSLYSEYIEYDLHFKLAYYDNWTPKYMKETSNGSLKFLKLGENFKNSKEVVYLEKVLTSYNGNCFRISVISDLSNSYDILKMRGFSLYVNQTITYNQLKNLYMTTYITSKINSNGVIFNNWKDGRTMKVTFKIPDNLKLVDLKSHMRTYSKTKSTCRWINIFTNTVSILLVRSRSVRISLSCWTKFAKYEKFTSMQIFFKQWIYTAL